MIVEASASVDMLKSGKAEKNILGDARYSIITDCEMELLRAGVTQKKKRGTGTFVPAPQGLEGYIGL
jgi:hypothetical protein